MNQERQEIRRAIIKRKEVEALTTLSRSTIYAKIDPKSRHYDPAFPKPVALGAHSVGWYSDQIENWINTRSHKSAA